MKLVDIRAVRVKVPPRPAKTTPRRESWGTQAEVANPMWRYANGYPGKR